MKLLSDILGIKYPIIQGGMAQIATGRFAAAVSDAGALGVIGTGGFSAEDLRQHIREARERTDKPFGVNILLLHPEAAELAEIAARERVAVVTTGAGDPGSFIPKWKDAGILVFPVVASAALAQRMERFGADAVIAEGTESGGHVGETATMALTPSVAAAVDIPVIAAGGIASGAQLLAAFALGAIGAQLGTLFLVSAECPIHENYKNALLKSRDGGTTVTGRLAGAPVRVLKNRMARDYIKLERDGASREELERLTLGSLRRAVHDGDENGGSLMAGQVAGQLTSVRPAAELLQELMREYDEARMRVSEISEALRV
ncbi:MAG: nitronate monooxygenase [Oscillospiraceae bacterium]|jgi:enoyl-[acyl-carrier protein] reductase II|nr:nitronate monooxygenase [Oscillospiraceae bacterium]